MEGQVQLPVLTEEQIRVLGSLIEKSKATPDYYPMTINAIQTACNQKSSRKPVVNYDEEIIITTLNSLKILGLVSTVTGGSSRTLKYKHNIAVTYPLLPVETTVLCLLFLRGPLTAGEINTNSNRLYEFETLEEVQQVLEKLSSEGYVKRLAKQPGQKEQRFMHLFSGEVTDSFKINDETTLSTNNTVLEERLARVELELTELKEKVQHLLNELMG